MSKDELERQEEKLRRVKQDSDIEWISAGLFVLVVWAILAI